MATQFLIDDQLVDTLTAAGIENLGGDAPRCPLNVGDFVTFERGKNVFFRVRARWLDMAAGEDEASWNIILELAPSNPLQK